MPGLFRTRRSGGNFIGEEMKAQREKGFVPRNRQIRVRNSINIYDLIKNVLTFCHLMSRAMKIKLGPVDG